MGPRTISGDPTSLVAAELHLVDAGVSLGAGCTAIFKLRAIRIRHHNVFCFNGLREVMKFHSAGVPALFEHQA